jgi:hypothetical protein
VREFGGPYRVDEPRVSGSRACAVVILAAVAGCGGDDRDAVLAVMEDARAALVAGDGEAACGLLSDHGRERMLEVQVDFAETGTPVPTTQRGVPQTCEQILRAEREEDPESVEDIERAAFRVVEIDGARASVRLDVPQDGPSVDFSLVETGDGWRIDDSDAVPSGY